MKKTAKYTAVIAAIVYALSMLLKLFDFGPSFLSKDMRTYVLIIFFMAGAKYFQLHKRDQRAAIQRLKMNLQNKQKRKENKNTD